jgi:probable biosynthetic protein (TIGR04098 family)
MDAQNCGIESALRPKGAEVHERAPAYGAAPPPLVGLSASMLSANAIARRTLLKPGMCGHNSLMVGQIGDWTWETVGAVSDTNVFTARDASGAPTYLAFYYYHIRASAGFHLGELTFGDSIRVISSVFDFGTESVLTLHQIERDEPNLESASAIDLEEFFERPRDNCIYVQNFNRWVARRSADSNEDLRRSSPLNFRHEHLPQLPEKYSPRPVYSQARRRGTFLVGKDAERPVVDRSSGEYQVDVTRDVNGVGLMYFAAYFSIVDKGIWGLWQQLGRDQDSFMRRVVLDQKLCYLGNANIGATLIQETSLVRCEVYGREAEAFNVIIRDRDSQRQLAVATVQVLAEPAR